jgi:hypothetical protein
VGKTHDPAGLFINQPLHLMTGIMKPVPDFGKSLMGHGNLIKFTILQIQFLPPFIILIFNETNHIHSPKLIESLTFL